MESDGSENGANGNGKVVYYYNRSHEKPKQLSVFNILLVLRVVTFGLSLAAVVLMGMDKHKIIGSDSKVKWYNYDAYRYVLAANAIISVYSLAEACLALCSMVKGSSLLPERFYVWFDYGHDQGFAYLLFSASSAGTVLAQNLRSGDIKILSHYACSDARNFCTQAELAIAMGFAAFLMIAFSSLLSGYRVARWLMKPAT